MRRATVDPWSTMVRDGSKHDLATAIDLDTADNLLVPLHLEFIGVPASRTFRENKTGSNVRKPLLLHRLSGAM